MRMTKKKWKRVRNTYKNYGNRQINVSKINIYHWFFFSDCLVPKLRRRVSFIEDKSLSIEELKTSTNEPICLIEFSHSNQGEKSAENVSASNLRKDPIFGAGCPEDSLLQDPIQALKPSELDSYFTKARKKSILKPYDAR